MAVANLDRVGLVTGNSRTYWPEKLLPQAQKVPVGLPPQAMPGAAAYCHPICL